jgi:hypothetical protein
MSSPDSSTSNAQLRVESACAEAARLAAESTAVQVRLRDARRQRATLERQIEGGALADPRVLASAKIEAQQAYRKRVERAEQTHEVIAAATAWLSEVDRLNQASAQAAGQARSIADHVREADALIERLELSARAASVAAASARNSCLEARRAQARHDEALTGPPGHTGDATVPSLLTPRDGVAPVEALIRGDRSVVQMVAAQLAEEIGLDAGRLQLLLLELREALIGRAFEEAAFQFPADNRFWSQFTRAEARAIAASLAVLGRGFDGRSGWQNGRPAEPREMAIALSLAGHDLRTLRHRPTRGDIDTLWRGVTITAVEHLAERAPTLGLEALVAMLGARAEGLADLWDNWGRLRGMLLGTAPAAPGSPVARAAPTVARAAPAA